MECHRRIKDSLRESGTSNVQGINKKHGNSEQWKQKSEQGSKQETLHITAVPSQQKTVSLIFLQMMVHAQCWEKVVKF